MPALNFSGNDINEVLQKIQNHIQATGISTITKNIYLLPEELAERWRIHDGHLGNLRVSGEGPAYMKLSEGKYGKVRYPLFGEGGVLCHEGDRIKHSTME